MALTLSRVIIDEILPGISNVTQLETPINGVGSRYGRRTAEFADSFPHVPATNGRRLTSLPRMPIQIRAFDATTDHNTPEHMQHQ